MAELPPHRRWRFPGPIAWLVLIAAIALVLFPLLSLVRTLVMEGGGRIGAILSQPGLAAAVRNTAVVSVVVTALAVPAGTALALTLRRPHLPAKNLLWAAVLLPVLVPDLVVGYSWLHAYGPGGLTEDLLGLSWGSLQGPVGVIVVMSVHSVPLVCLVCLAGLGTRTERAAERAARMCGARPSAVLLTITLPLMGPAIAAAAVLSFVLTMSSFAIPQVLGTPAGFSTITTHIYGDLTRSSDQQAFVGTIVLALVLVIATALVVIPADTFLGRRLRSARVAGPDPSGPAGRRTWLDRSAAVAVGGCLCVGIGIPLAALVATSLTKAAGLAPTPQNWTLTNFADVITARTVAAFGRSALLAIAAAFLIVVLGGCAAVLERRGPGGGLATLVTLTMVLPGSTLALALLITYGRWLAGTVGIILLAYVAKLWAFGHRPIAAALDRLPADEVRAARINGATTLTAVRTVVLPPLAPALLAAWAICLVTALHEVTMSSLLYGPGSETLAVVVLNSAELGRVGVTCALAVLLTLVVLIPAVALWLLARRMERKSQLPRIDAHAR